MFSASTRDGKAFAGEQKFRKIKIFLSESSTKKAKKVKDYS